MNTVGKRTVVTIQSMRYDLVCIDVIQNRISVTWVPSSKHNYLGYF